MTGALTAPRVDSGEQPGDADVSRTPARRRSARLRDPLTWATVVVAAAGLALRVWLLNSPHAVLDSDEAVTGIMANGILRGHLPVVVSGNDYGGVTEAYLLAPLMAVFGGSILAAKLVSVVLWGLVAVAVWRVVGHVASREVAIVAGAALWVFSGPFAVVSVIAWLGYASGVLFCALALDGVSRATGVAAHGEAVRPRQCALAGLFAGLAVWSHPLFLVSLLPAFALATILMRHAWRRWLIPVCAGGSLALAPFLVWNARHRFPSRHLPPPAFETSYLERLRLVWRELIPRAYGMRGVKGDWLYGRWLGGAMTLAVVALAHAGLALLIWRDRHRAGPRSGAVTRSGTVLAVSGLLGIPLLALSDALWWFEDGRYFMVLLVPHLVGLAVVVDVAVRRWPVCRRFVFAVPVAWGLVTCGRWAWKEVPHRFEDPNRDVAAVVDTLRRNGVTAVTGEYWAVYRISFVTDERIAAAASNGTDRFPYLRRRVEATDPAQSAYVYAESTLPQGLPADSPQYRHLRFPGFTLTRTSPPETLHVYVPR